MAFEALASTGNTVGGTLFGANESRKARDWATRMANTVYQRTIQDLEKADLNPILAVRLGGNATPPTPPTPQVHGGVSGVDLDQVHTARNLITKKAQDVANVNLTNAQANKQHEENDLIAQQRKKTKAETDILNYQKEQAKAESHYYEALGGWAPAARTIAPLMNMVPGVSTAKGLFDIWQKARGTTTVEDRAKDGRWRIRTTRPALRRR